MKRNILHTLFPETVPIRLGKNHFKILQLLLENPDGILQKNIVKKSQIDKTSVSEIKDDLIALGWCISKELYVTKELRIIPSKIDTIKNFLGYCRNVGNCLYVRPHDIVMECRITKSGDIHPNIFYSLSTKYPVIISDMKNNRQYCYKTEYGNIQLYHKGDKVIFYITAFIIPIQEKDLEIFEEYVVQEIHRRFEVLNDIIKEHLKKYRISLSNVVHLNTLHLGIVTSENIARILKTKKILKDLGIFFDKSISGCVECENKGKPEKVFNSIKEAMRNIFEIENKGGK